MKRLFVVPYGSLDTSNLHFRHSEAPLIDELIAKLILRHADELTCIIVRDESYRANQLTRRIRGAIPHAVAPSEKSGYVINVKKPEASITPIRDLFTQTTNLIIISDTNTIRRLANTLSADIDTSTNIVRLMPRLEFGTCLAIDRQTGEVHIVNLRPPAS